MEQVALNNVQLDYLAREHAVLKPHFYGTVVCDRLPKKPLKTQPQAYIVNTVPHHQPGEHWLDLWSQGNVCEVMDSYALPMKNVRASHTFERLDCSALEVRGDQWPIPSSHQQQQLRLLCVAVRESQSPRTHVARILNDFSDHDYVSNDHKAAARVKQLICNELGWRKVCQTPYHQRCC